MSKREPDETRSVLASELGKGLADDLSKLLDRAPVGSHDELRRARGAKLFPATKRILSPAIRVARLEARKAGTVLRRRARAEVESMAKSLDAAEEADRALAARSHAEADSKGYSVHGRVRDAETGLGLAGILVVARDSDGGRKYDDLGETLTDTEGNYRIPFTEEAIGDRDKIAELYVEFRKPTGQLIERVGPRKCKRGKPVSLDYEVTAKGLAAQRDAARTRSRVRGMARELADRRKAFLERRSLLDSNR